jgi:hypothetical protein
MRIFYNNYSLYLTCSLFAFAACAEADYYDSQESIDKLLRGEVTTIRPEVGRLSLNGSLCTGTLIRPKVVISAAHCVGYRTRTGRFGDFVVEHDGQAHRFVIDSVYSFGNRLGEKDIALLHLSRAVPSSLAKPTSIALNEPTQGDVTIFGYGCSNRRTQRGSGRKQFYTHNVATKSNQLCPGDSGGPVVVGTAGPVFRINSGYYTSSRGGDIYGRPTRYYRELSAFANVMNLGGLSELQDFIRKGGVEQEGGEQFVGDGSIQNDQEPPSIHLISPADKSEHSERSVIEISAKITDDNSYVQAELIWNFNGNSYPCPHRSRYVSCTQEGTDTFRWSVEVGEGERTFSIRALDLAGQETTSASRTIYLLDAASVYQQPNEPSDSGENTSPNGQGHQVSPQIEVISPTQQNSVPEESSVQIIAEIESNVGLRETHLVWDYNQELYPCPTRQTYADCDVNGSQYIWTVRVTAAGARPFHIEAVDINGQRGYSSSYQIDVISQPIEPDDTPPQINMLEPTIDEIWQEHSQVYVTAQINDPSGIATAKLQWDFNGNDYPCPHRSQYVDCDVSGDLYQWVVKVSEGSRSFRVWAQDIAGNSAQSQSYQINLHP